MCQGSEREDLHPPSESSGTMDGSVRSWGREPALGRTNRDECAECAERTGLHTKSDMEPAGSVQPGTPLAI